MKKHIIFYLANAVFVFLLSFQNSMLDSKQFYQAGDFEEPPAYKGGIYLKNDLVDRRFFGDNERYADLINGLRFHGTYIIHPEYLMEQDTATGIFKVPPVLHRKRRPAASLQRDLIRKTALGTNFAILGIENQTLLDYSMVLRTMAYDVSEYERQASLIRKKIRKQKTGLSAPELLYGFGKYSRLFPVITFVLFYGDEWSAATHLHEIIDFTDIPPELAELVPDYPLNIIKVKDLTDTNVFHTDIRQVFDVIRFSKDSSKLKQLVSSDSYYQKMDEDAFDFVATHTHSSELFNVKQYFFEKGKINMCEAITTLIAEGKAEGKAEGEMKILIHQIRKKYNRGLSLSSIADAIEVEESFVSEILSLLDSFPHETDEQLARRFLSLVPQ